MKLIGMLDSPCVRRVAVCLDVLGVSFEHEAVSVFSTFERFRKINPVVKAPTLVGDDGGILMDSAPILQYVETVRGEPSPLWSSDPLRRLHQFRMVGCASAACEKTVQLVYETQLRPESAQHEPWKSRVRSQLHAAFETLESLTSGVEAASAESDNLNHAAIWSAIAWQCAGSLIPGELPAGRHPCLDGLSRRLEALPVFRRYPPDGPGVPGRNPA